MNNMSNVNLFLGRIIIEFILVFGAIFKLFNYEFTLNYMFDHALYRNTNNHNYFTRHLFSINHSRLLFEIVCLCISTTYNTNKLLYA